MKAPAGWDSVLLQSIAEVRSGLSKSSSRQGKSVRKPYLRVANVQDGFVDLSEIKEIEVPINQIDRFTLRSGDLLLIEGNGNPENLGRGCIWAGQIADCVHQNHIFAVRTLHNADLLPEFLMLQLQSRRGRNYLLSCAKSSTGLATLNSQQLKQFPVLLPHLPEQRKIAEILRTWDLGLEKLEALRAAKLHQLEGFTARLIHKARAEPQHLREHMSEVSERNSGQCVDRVLSVTNSAGFVLAEEQFAHRVASADISNYKIVRQGQYAYNPSRINVGSIARLDNWPEGALSPMYVVFEVRDTLDSDFFGHWLRSGEARKRIALAAQGSVRDTVSFGDLGSILVPLPPLVEQRRIARALSAVKEELSLLNEEIEALTRQKRGLMQKLLTGEWRVAV